MMNRRQMEVFHAIMQTGSVTAAARVLHVTQPAVSAVLKHCEEQLGLKLFERTGGRLQPTREAEAIFPDIAGVFGQLEEVKDLTQDLAAGRRSEENTSELQSLMRSSYAVFSLKKKKTYN